METFKELIAGEQLVLVDFFATWCQPCKMMHPVLEQVKQALGDKLRIIKVDVAQNRETAHQYQIQSDPTLMLFQRGILRWRASGAASKAELLSVIDPFIQ